MGVYGDFLTVFPELFSTIEFRDGKKRRMIYVDTRNADVFRQKMGNKSTSALDMGNHSYLYAPVRVAREVKEGDRFVHPEFGYEMSIVGRVSHAKAAGYDILKVERVTGADSTQTDKLVVKEPRFD